MSVITASEVLLDFYAVTRKGSKVTDAVRAFLSVFTAQLREGPQLNH